MSEPSTDPPPSATTGPEPIEQAIADLKELRDRLRVRAHLAGMEARARWEALHPRVEQFERDLQARGAAMGQSMEDTARRLRRECAALWEQIKGK